MLSAALLIVCLTTGCASLDVPSIAKLDLMDPSALIPTGESSEYRMVDGAQSPMLAADGSMSMETYQRIRQAKEQNAVVLQVAGDEAPIRVLPLPEQGKSVFVSELLTQTGLLKKFGAVNATLFRPSADSISGIRMDVKLTEDGKIDPASDYALQAGDRVHVSQRTSSGLQSLVDVALRR